jgi:hypothetical protein
VTVEGLSTAGFKSVAFGNGRFVAGGGGWSTQWDTFLMHSSDGIAWTKASIKAGDETNIGKYGLVSIVYSKPHGRFVAVGSGGILTSVDGINWSMADQRVLSAVATGNGFFYGVGGYGEIHTSLDGLSWSKVSGSAGRNASDTLFGMTGITFGRGSFFATAENSTILKSASAVCGSLNRAAESFTPAGGSASVTVTDSAIPAACHWSALTNDPWISVTAPPTTGIDGSGTATFTVTANACSHARTGMVNIAGWLLSVSQGPAGLISVNGTCGTSNGGSFSVSPTSGLCIAGTASEVIGTGPWNWTCVGSNGGTNASCTATKIIVNVKPGDCDNNGTVTIAEVQSAINMFLGLKMVETCVDRDNSNDVSIAEVQRVINSFLGL